MLNSDILKTWLENICGNNAEDITALYSEDAVIITDDSDEPLMGEMDIFGFYDWYINRDPCVELTFSDSKHLEGVEVVNGNYTIRNMEGVFHKRFTFVISGGKIIAQHTSTDPLIK